MRGWGGDGLSVSLDVWEYRQAIDYEQPVLRHPIVAPIDNLVDLNLGEITEAYLPGDVSDLTISQVTSGEA